MATFKIETVDQDDKSIEADYVEFADGRYVFRTTDQQWGSAMISFIIADKYVRSVTKS